MGHGVCERLPAVKVVVTGGSGKAGSRGRRASARVRPRGGERRLAPSPESYIRLAGAGPRRGRYRPRAGVRGLTAARHGCRPPCPRAICRDSVAGDGPPGRTFSASIRRYLRWQPSAPVCNLSSASSSEVSLARRARRHAVDEQLASVPSRPMRQLAGARRGVKRRSAAAEASRSSAAFSTYAVPHYERFPATRTIPNRK